MLHSVIGWNCVLGAWSRVEGYPCDPNPNDPLARIQSESLFNKEGRLNPSITILGKTSDDYFIITACALFLSNPRQIPSHEKGGAVSAWGGPVERELTR